jgi:CDP-4-dehydro-6-deoxyglucose reductase
MHNVTLKPSGQQFQVEAGETVLAAALRQGLVLPYGCKNGACGSCKGKVLEGRVDYGVYQKRVFTDEEKAQGKALFCQAKPLGDVVIEARAGWRRQGHPDQDAALPRADARARGR